MAAVTRNYQLVDNGAAISSTAGANNLTSTGVRPDAADVVILAILGGTVAGSHTFSVQGSNDNSTWTTVTADSTGGASQPLTAAGIVEFHLAQLGYTYYRLVDTTTGTPGSANTVTSVYEWSYLRFSDNASLT
jgi:hypothetical protein